MPTCPKGWKMRAIHPKIIKRLEKEVKRRKDTVKRANQTEIINTILVNYYKIK